MRLAWTKVLKKLPGRKVEFGGGIGAILQQSRVLLDDLQYTVCSYGHQGIIDCGDMRLCNEIYKLCMYSTWSKEAGGKK